MAQKNFHDSRILCYHLWQIPSLDAASVAHTADAASDRICHTGSTDPPPPSPLTLPIVDKFYTSVGQQKTQCMAFCGGLLTLFLLLLSLNSFFSSLSFCLFSCSCFSFSFSSDSIFFIVIISSEVKSLWLVNCLLFFFLVYAVLSPAQILLIPQTRGQYLGRMTVSQQQHQMVGQHL